VAASRLLSVLTSEPDGPVVRHRWLAFGPRLAAAGIHLDVVPWPKDPARREDALRRVTTADGVVVSRRLLPRPLWRDLRRRARRLAYDFDDAVPYRDTFAGAGLSRTRWRRFRRMVAGADRVLAGNSHLADLAGRAGRQAAVVPTVVDVPDGSPTPEPADGVPVVGWIGSASTLPYLEARAAELSAVMASGHHFRMRVIADVPPSLPPGIAVDFVPWTPDGWQAALEATHLGIAPLPDDAWTRGKCGLKVLQMLATGRPVVASAVGVQREQVRHGATGYLAGTPETLVEGLLRLLDDPAARRRMGAAARADARARWSLEAWGPRVLDQVEKLLA
jgi:glycosyltransferase involved in cell wall biosynthesis